MPTETRRIINAPCFIGEPVLVVRARNPHMIMFARQAATRLEGDIKRGRPIPIGESPEQYREIARQAETWRRENAGSWYDAQYPALARQESVAAMFAGEGGLAVMTPQATRCPLQGPTAAPECEKALLAALLVAPAPEQARIGALLTPERFSNALHGKIFDAIVRRVIAGDAYTTLGDIVGKLAEDADFKAAGGLDYLQELVLSLKGVANAREYAEEIYHCWVRRRIDNTIEATRVELAEEPSLAPLANLVVHPSPAAARAMLDDMGYPELEYVPIAKPSEGLEPPAMSDLLVQMKLTPAVRADLERIWRAGVDEPAAVTAALSLPDTPEWREARAAAAAWQEGVAKEERQRQAIEALCRALPHTRSMRTRFAEWWRVQRERRAAAVKEKRERRAVRADLVRRGLAWWP